MLCQTLQAKLDAIGTDALHVPNLEQWARFLEALSQSFSERDADRYALERSIMDSTSAMGELQIRLESERDLLRAVFESLGDGVVVLDDIGTIMLANPVASAMLDYRPVAGGSVQIGQLLEAEQPDGLGGVFGKALLAVLSDGTPYRDESAVLTLLNGQRLEVALCVAPVQGRTGTSGAVMILRDISSRRMLEMELRQAQKLESVGEMAAGIAHEINTPIQYVGDNIRFLRDSFAELLAAAGAVHEGSEAQAADLGYLSEEVPKAIEQSLEGVDRVATIVRAMKHISHPDGDEKSIADINQGIASAATVTRNEWKYCAEVELDLDPNLPSIGCYPGALSQVLINLIVNAAHAIDEANRKLSREGKGRIVITSRSADESIVIKIADDGAGIPESIRHRIFDPFFTTKGVGKGTGQGLALSRSIINQRHGGEISFETEPGAGTTFTIRLPVGDQKPCPA